MDEGTGTKLPQIIWNCLSWNQTSQAALPLPQHTGPPFVCGQNLPPRCAGVTISPTVLTHLQTSFSLVWRIGFCPDSFTQFPYFHGVSYCFYLTTKTFPSSHSEWTPNPTSSKVRHARPPSPLHASIQVRFLPASSLAYVNSVQREVTRTRVSV